MIVSHLHLVRESIGFDGIVLAAIVFTIYKSLGLYLEIEDVSQPSEKPCDAFR